MKHMYFKDISLFIIGAICVLMLAIVFDNTQKIKELELDNKLLNKRLNVIEYNVKLHDRMLDYPNNDDINKYDYKIEDLYEGNIESK